MPPAPAASDDPTPSPRPSDPTSGDDIPDALSDLDPLPHGEIVVILAADFRLPNVLRHLEAGKIVLVIPAPREPPSGA
ncbi:hypothetical protein FF36_05862 [Frankia torreyi]|uniref:Uncharacterized protein n=1 Tax=Frankia torreyi TaxID=1856 RepID=A0A0D8B703_9ACTN|nr:hypothetical protein FF36_05862 [Frankia torreyi]KQM02218.1 hypothetical protein FF86_107622 [Frankia sp. CpI1-P]